MKRLLALVFCLLFSFSALSERETGNPFDCDCGAGETCVCFLQEGDEGIFTQGVIRLLYERGYLPFSHARGVFDREVTEAVMRFQREMDLDETGMLDDETLTMLIFFELPEALQYGETEKLLVWVPTDGGKKRHIRKECSRMIAPRKISNRNAAALGIEMCKRCMKNMTEDAYE